ncbi:hypothetical protein ACTFIU_007263 [Dictyostelium citrinum]
MENQNERLFWLVFRNKNLNRLIFKRSDFKYEVYTYNELNNVQWMLNNKHFSLLKEKIIRNDRNLNFNSGDQSLLNSQPPIFRYYKDDMELFSNLLKNYNNDKSFFELNSTYLEILSLENDNVALLKVIINDLKHYSDLETFYKVINIGSIGIATYLYNNHFKDIISREQPESTNTLWNEAIGYQPNIKPKFNKEKCFKNYEDSYDKKVEFYFNNISKVIPPFSKEINKKSSTPTEINSYGNPALFDTQIYDLLLVRLIGCCKTISSLFRIEQPEFKYSNNDIIEMDQLKQYEIPGIIFTKEELNSKVHSFSFKNTIVQRLFKMMLLFSDSPSLLKSFYLNIAFYQMKYQVKETNDISYTGIFIPHSFGYYTRGSLGGNTKTGIAMNRVIPLEYCRNDREDRIIPFFKDAIKESLDPSIDESSKPCASVLIKYAIILNDLEIIEMIYNQLTIDQRYNILNIKVVASGNENTNLDFRIFDFFYIRLTEKEKLNILNNIILNYQLSNHFKNNHPIDFKKSVLNYVFPPKNTLLPKFLVENYKEFPNKQNEFTSRFSHFIYRSAFSGYKLPLVFSYPNSDGIEVELKIPPYKLINSKTCSSAVLQLNVILQYRSQDIEDGTFEASYDIMLITQYLRNNIEETILNDNKNSYYQQKHLEPSIFNYLLEEIAKRGDTTTIQFLIDQFKDNQPFLDHIINYSKSFSLKQSINQIDFYNYLNNKTF